MKKILIGIAVQIGVLCGVEAQTPNILKAHGVNGTDTIALALVDSIVHSTDSMQLHLGNSMMNYALNKIDSMSYASIDVHKIPCNFGGYSGQYGSMTDSRDGNVYKTVTIANQTWMAENLRYDVPGVYTYHNSSTDNATDTLNLNNPCKSYGRLYDWKTLMNGDTSSSGNPSTAQGICPSGWHLPSEAEWKELEKVLGMSQVVVDVWGWRGTDEGTKMKSIVGWKNNGNGSNASGFSAFPAGYYSSGTGSFGPLDNYLGFWSSTGYSAGRAWSRDLSNGNVTMYRGTSGKINGSSCRCLEN